MFVCLFFKPKHDSKKNLNRITCFFVFFKSKQDSKIRNLNRIQDLQSETNIILEILRHFFAPLRACKSQQGVICSTLSRDHIAVHPPPFLRSATLQTIPSPGCMMYDEHLIRSIVSADASNVNHPFFASLCVCVIFFFIYLLQQLAFHGDRGLR